MQQPHFLLIPYSEQGHFNPMLSLASHLAALGCKVTFVKAEREFTAHAAAPGDVDAAITANSQAGAASPTDQKVEEAAAPTMTMKETAVLTMSRAESEAAASLMNEEEKVVQAANLQFVTLPARKMTALGTIPRHQIFRRTLAGLEERRELVAQIVQDSKRSAHPISCVICDYILWRWVRHIAHAHALRSAVLSIFSALTFFTWYLKFGVGEELEIEDILVSSFDMPSQKDVVAHYGLTTMKDTLELKLQKENFFHTLYEGFEDMGPILINSFETLEAPVIPSLKSLGFDVRFIGPCLPAWNKDDLGFWSKMAQYAGSIFIEDEACLSWLDLQEKGSVLFVSFGSEGVLEDKQVEEIAMGIEKSGCKFLWVFRLDAPTSNGPTQFYSEQNSLQDKGMVVSWAPQRKVLQHPSIGGFLTHSGWNSTLESITFGVPMLCLPLLGDQPMNANFVSKYLQVGIRLTIGQDGLVHREEVANGVQSLMQGQFFDRVSKLSQEAHLALENAHQNLVSFVQALT